MLPGFRFLVAAIVFSLSLLVFGLGAAALFRAAHEQFASYASWHATPSASLTSFLPQPEPPQPTLALLRIEPSLPPQIIPTSMPIEVEPAPASVETRVTIPDIAAMPAATSDTPAAAAADLASITPDVTSTVSVALPAPATEPAITVTPAAPALSHSDVVQSEIATRENADVDVTSPKSTGPDRAASAIAEVAKPDVAKPEIIKAEITKPEIVKSETTTPVVANAQPVSTAVPVTPAVTPEHREAPAKSFTEAQVLASADIVTGDSPSSSQLATTAAPVAPPATDAIAMKIASLGDQPVASTKKASVKTASVQLHQSLAKKRLAKERLAKERLAQARRAKQQHQMAQRARAARQAAAAQQQQQYADPFAQPQAFGQQQQQAAARTR